MEVCLKENQYIAARKTQAFVLIAEMKMVSTFKFCLFIDICFA